MLFFHNLPVTLNLCSNTYLLHTKRYFLLLCCVLSTPFLSSSSFPLSLYQSTTLSSVCLHLYKTNLKDALMEKKNALSSHFHAKRFKVSVIFNVLLTNSSCSILPLNCVWNICILLIAGTVRKPLTSDQCHEHRGLYKLQRASLRPAAKAVKKRQDWITAWNFSNFRHPHPMLSRIQID